MCNLFFYLSKCPKPNGYKLIIVNNRDEFYDRPTANAHIWDTVPKLIAGEDLVRGGTWLCASEAGKIGCLLNILKPIHLQLDPSMVETRGSLTLDFLKDESSGVEYIEKIKKSNKIYNNFNLVLIEPTQKKSFQATIYNSTENVSKDLSVDEFHGFGNNNISHCFKKIEKGKERFEKIVKTFAFMDKESLLLENLFGMMRNSELYFPDPAILSQSEGYKEEFQKGLSSCFVAIPSANYGTRTMSIILVDNDDNLKFHEHTMSVPSATCTEWEKSEFTFKLNFS